MAGGGILTRFVYKAIADCQGIDRGSHEASPRVFWCAHDGLAAHVETGIDEDRASGAFPERTKQGMVEWVSLAMHGLNARRVVYVRDRRNLRPQRVQPL